jgi:hypothetical protein
MPGCEAALADKRRKRADADREALWRIVAGDRMQRCRRDGAVMCEGLGGVAWATPLFHVGWYN